MQDAMQMTDEERAERECRILIGQQNDRFRRTWGADFAIPGQIVMTRGVAGLPASAQVAVMQAVARFDSFTEDNDPYLDRTFGAFEIVSQGQTYPMFWKIDLYDAAYEYGSPDPADPKATRRVLTIMHTHEY